jgi:hypothetical protein
LALFFIILSRVAWTSSLQEGFAVKNAWSKDLVAKFLKFQKVLNPNVVFDMKVVQQQASPDEVEYLFKHNKWPWSKQVIDIYKQAVAENSFVKVDPGISMIDAQRIYNEMAMKQILSFGTKEGTFLLNGVVIGHNKKMPSNVNDVVRCGTDPKTKRSVVEKVVYNGYDSISGAMNKTVTNVGVGQIPGLVNGFKFLNGPCNPCSPLDNPPNYSCPFSLNTGNGAEVSPIWKLLWYPGGVVPNKTMNETSSKTGSGSEKFPILKQLKNELNNTDFIRMIKGSDGNEKSTTTKQHVNQKMTTNSKNKK